MNLYSLKINNKIFKKYHFLISLLFFPLIYFLGWVSISLLIYPFPFLSSDKSLFGTIITFLIFLLYLPGWSKHKWGKDLRLALGVIKLKDKKLGYSLIFEFAKALLIIFTISLFAIIGDYATFVFKFNKFIFLNSIFLGLIVGFAEELVFRVWLFEELNLFLKKRYANILQAILFSIFHIRWDLNFLSNIQLSIGLFLLGLYLNKWRESKYRTVLFPICFHGSIVSLWFLMNSSFLTIEKNIPKILFGPGNGIQINPIGGLFGILIIFLLIFFDDSRLKRYHLIN